MVFIYRFIVHQLIQCVSCMGGLYIQVTLYFNYYSVSLGWSLDTGYTVLQLLQCVPWVVFRYRSLYTSTTTVCPFIGVVIIYRLPRTSTTTMWPLGGLYIQVTLYINYYSVSLGWSLYTGSTVHQLHIVSLGWSFVLYGCREFEM